MCVRSKSGVFASRFALQIKKEAKTSLPHGARVVRPQDEGVPAFDVLRLLQPDVFLGVVQSVLESHSSESAMSCAQVVDALCDTPRPSMEMAKLLRREWGVPRGAASVMLGVPPGVGPP